MTLPHYVDVARFSAPAGVPDLGYRAAPEFFALPPGVNFGPCSAVAVNSRGHLFVFNRGRHSLMEFDPEGNYLHSLAEGVFTHPHGLRIDREDNIWATDGGSHFVAKLDPRGRVLMVLGVKGSAREMHPGGHLRCFEEPNDIAFGHHDEIYITQGHGKGAPYVIKFDANGDFVTAWGGEGTAPGQFDVPHAIVVDPEGLVHVADRTNQRVQVFDADGNYIRESRHPGTPCGLCLSRDRAHLFMAHGHAGVILKLDLMGKVLGATGSQGKGPNQYGEAHYLTIDAREDIYVADSLNWRVQKLVK
jgi:sugar lactone lactonase YvrE